MQALDKDLRGALEKTVKAARETAEIAAFAALDQLGVGHDKPEAFLSDAEKALRNRLRTHGKQLGDARDSKSTNPTYGKQEVQHLVQEVAYQHWHRMLFARFLADNDLLMYDGVAVTIEECDELAADEGAKNGWELAGKLAARMLPQVFKPGSPVFELTFAPEHQSELERLLKTLPDAVFKASDSLGWVYQFWQADNKERINKSEVKIGADELPAVTQLFTEPYMVAFLLHNSLGAWWVTRHPKTPCPVDLTYLRFAPNEDGSNAVPPAPTFEGQLPAAGKFEGWPDSLAELKLLDPCCGSGHFLVAAFLMLVPMRMAAEGLSAKEAVNRVLAHNLHGLELDPRCVEIAVFAVALEAWRYPDASGKPLGVREIPAPNIACCGLKVAAKAQDWEALVPDNAHNAEYVRQELRQLHASFSDAPLLGSLLNPARSLKNDLATSSTATLEALLNKALAGETCAKDLDDAWDIALSAQGLLEAARLLSLKYQFVITNVPYLGLRGMSKDLQDFVTERYANSKADLATVMLERIFELLQGRGVVASVSPQNWLYQPAYEEFRQFILSEKTFLNLTVLGEGGFASQQAAGAFVSLTLLENRMPDQSSESSFLDATSLKGPEGKANLIKSEQVRALSQSQQLNNPGKRVLQDNASSVSTLQNFAIAPQGIKTGDDDKWVRNWWEQPISADWEFIQSAVNVSEYYGGRQWSINWSTNGNGMVRPRHDSPALGKLGVAVSQTRNKAATLYTGERFNSSLAPIVPAKESDLAALWLYCSSEEFRDEVGKISPGLFATNSALLDVPFDANRWRQAAESKYPLGLPKPYSNDPSQWIFHGHPKSSTAPLQVAVARLVGFTWPAEADEEMELSDEARMWIARSKTLASHVDGDGIVCIPPVGREASASDRLMNLLADAYGTDWSNDVLGQLLAAADHGGKSLETWLRDKFFTQHCALFGNRPFVWHIWDGLSDGFAALINYHRLDYKTLENLTYSYLGQDWIGRLKRDADNNVDGAEEKLAAAEMLKKRLELILAGETPYDIFIRWKPIEEQPIGWNPDLNDGVRLNIRPFVLAEDIKVRDAGVLRDRVTSRDPKTKELKLWGKDRGGNVPSAPWYELGLQYGGKVGDRINDHHLTLAEKRAAREKAK